MADFTLLANWAASSPSCSQRHVGEQSRAGLSEARACVRAAEAYLDGHGREVPHVDHDGPAGHHPQHVADHVVFAAVPEGVAETSIVLGRNEV